MYQDAELTRNKPVEEEIPSENNTALSDRYFGGSQLSSAQPGVQTTEYVHVEKEVIYQPATTTSGTEALQNNIQVVESIQPTQTATYETTTSNVNYIPPTISQPIQTGTFRTVTTTLPTTTLQPGTGTEGIGYTTSTFITPQKGTESVESLEQRFAATNISEIPRVEERYMKDSTQLDKSKEVEVNQSKWEQQQSDLASMRIESHQTFETWEKNRNLFVNDRLSVIDDLLAGMEKQVNWLDIGVEKAILFFKEREDQELQFSKTVRHDLPQLGAHFNSANHPELLSDFSNSLKESDDFHAKQTKNSEILANFIKKDILDWVLLASEKQYKLSSGALRHPLSGFRKHLDLLAFKRHRYYDKYFKLYDNVQRNPTQVSKQGGLFKRQLKYSLAAREELRILRLYAEQGLLVIEEFAKLSVIRLDAIQKAFSLYYQKYNELNQNYVPIPTPIADLINQANSPNAIQGLFLPQNLMSSNSYSFIQQKLGKSEVTYQDLNAFLVNFPESIDPARSSFVLREWEAIKQGGLLKRPRPCNIVATTNNDLLIVEKKDESKELGKVGEPMQLRYTRVDEVQPEEDGTVLRVVERTPGTFFHHTHHTRLKFGTQQEAQQFLQFVNNQTSGDV
jgi:hypothetical protein